MRLLTLNENSFEPTNYAERKTAKAVIVDSEGRSLTLGPYLIGGGVEEGETFEAALHREAMEEAGITIEIIRHLGEIVSYRDALKKKYVTEGFLCKYLATVSKPTSTDPEEMENELIWETPDVALVRFEVEVDALKKTDKGSYSGDGWQSRLFNRTMTLTFLKEAFK